MSSAATTRAVLRQSRFLLRQRCQHQSIRQASSTTDAAAKAKETASAAASRASEGLSRVASTAGPAITNAVSGAGNALRKVGGPVGKVVSFVDSLIPPTLYYARVGLELSKLVFKGQNMYPPNTATFQSYFQSLLNTVKSPSNFVKGPYSPDAILNSIRNASRQQLVDAGIVGAQVIGFFTAGTMIGKAKIVGYRGGSSHGH